VVALLKNAIFVIDLNASDPVYGRVLKMKVQAPDSEGYIIYRAGTGPVTESSANPPPFGSGWKTEPAVSVKCNLAFYETSLMKKQLALTATCFVSLLLAPWLRQR